MNVCVVGCGMQGSVAAHDLAKSGHKVVVVDANAKNLSKLSRYENIKTRRFDVMKRNQFVKFMKNFDITLGALPSALGFYTMECAIAAGVDLVDMSYLPEDPFFLHGAAKKRKIKIIPDAGFAPGLSNILIGEAYKKFGGLDRLRILVGGIPQEPIPPFNYRITWSPADLLEEYTRPARIIRNYRETTVETLSGIKEFNMPKIGRLECFYTDGLRTLMKTLRNVKDMEEKTIRYPGHAKLFKTIIECGFLSENPILINKRSCTPKSVTLDILKNMLSQGNKEDLSILIIELSHKHRTKKMICVDYYDEKHKITSMARMTAYSGSIITQCIKGYKGFGVIPPEYLGMDDNFFAQIERELKKRKIIIKKYSK